MQRRLRSGCAAARNDGAGGPAPSLSMVSARARAYHSGTHAGASAPVPVSVSQRTSRSPILSIRQRWAGGYWRAPPEPLSSNLAESGDGTSVTRSSAAAVRAEVFLAADRPGPAYAAAMAGIETEGQPPTMCEWLLPLAARALADLAQSARDDGESPAELLALLDRLLGNFPAAFREQGTATELYAAQNTAFDMLYRAEDGRARGRAGNAREWIQTADACQAATLRWEEAYSCWRAANALLMRGHSLRPLAATVLRRGLDLAEELQALPILAHLRNLAAGARITAPGQAGAPAAVPAQLPGLTRREREILGFVVAGHTYAEIARHLVISEKTVSSHISNLLRKTGASNRLDLSRLANRSAAAGSAAAGPGPEAAPGRGPAH